MLLLFKFKLILIKTKVLLPSDIRETDQQLAEVQSQAQSLRRTRSQLTSFSAARNNTFYRELENNYRNQPFPPPTTDTSDDNNNNDQQQQRLATIKETQITASPTSTSLNSPTSTNLHSPTSTKS